MNAVIYFAVIDLHIKISPAVQPVVLPIPFYPDLFVVLVCDHSQKRNCISLVSQRNI